MNINIKQGWKAPKNATFMTLAWFVVGSFAGFILGHPPVVPMACRAPMLRAHFLERQIAFETSVIRSASSESLRAAAPDEPSSSERSTLPISSSSVSVVNSLSVPQSSTSKTVESSSSSAVSSAESASSSSAISESTSASSSHASVADTDFPAFERAVYPIGRVPNWGAMKTPAEWNRDYDEMRREEFVRLPMYDMDDLTTPMKELLKDRDDPQNIRTITAKLFYSTRFFGTYDLDSDEFSGTHAGIDLKLPKGTPVVAIAGGRVSLVAREESGLGNHVIIEHRLGDKTFYSIYGHLSSIGVTDGQDVTPGTYIGAVGNTGRSTGDHLHLQVDLGVPGESHTVYSPKNTPTRSEAARYTINPFIFVINHANEE